ncbi:MAG: hypothetical protein HFI28_07175 [Lachnospiraceae bacterium]|nr:hypothetical protein [Lachnospiraceae bacterium]
MEDEQIIKLYLKRSEKALEETQNKYGPYCYRIAKNILTVREDAEECIPSDFDVEENFDNQQLSDFLNHWLGELPKEDRVLFIKRYYYGDAVKN